MDPTPFPAPEGEDKTNKTLTALVLFLLKLTAVLVVVWVALYFVFGVYRLAGNNMYPALRDGDLCVTYRLEEYHADDVVVYRMANGNIRFGRIIARGGDTVDGDEAGVMVNGSYRNEEIFYPTNMVDIALALPVTLEPGQYMVLNDYREDLGDSRTYGVMNEDQLEGKVIFIFRRRGF